MANYCEVARTNYFRVKDAAAFKAFFRTVPGCEVIDKGNGTYCILLDDGVPSSMFNEEGEFVDFDFVETLFPFLADGSVAVVVASGAERLRYVIGYAIAVNNKGKVVQVHTDDIYELAKHLGTEITNASY